MQTFDQALFKLYKDGLISLEEALRNADSQNNLRLKISLSEGKTEVDPALKVEEKPDDPTVMGQRAGLLNMELEPKPR